MIFSDKYISDTDAESRLAYVSSSSSARARATPSAATQALEATAELSTLGQNGQSSSDGSPNLDFAEIPEAYEYMVLDSAPYLCSVPQVPLPQKNGSATKSKAEEEKELTRARDRGWELLKDMEGHCMYFISGWWSYSFCYNADIKQFHQLPPGRGGLPVFPPIEDPQTPAYYLGRYGGTNNGKEQPKGQPEQIEGSSKGSTGSAVGQLQTKGDMRYLVQNLGGGTTCDLTGKERKIEVQFHCHPQSADRIGYIKEVSTCSYLMIIYTPRLCNDVAFLPPRETKAHHIVCREIVPEAEVEEWQTRKAAEKERKFVDAGKNEKALPTVGGIEVGGMNIVGKNGPKIKPPKIVDPNQPKAEIVAKADPNEKGGRVQTLSKEDLKKLDLDPATVETLRKELQELAGEKAWSLEIVDGPDGRELRGIVEGAEEENGGGESQKGGEDDSGAQGESTEGSEEVFKDEL